MGDIESPRDSNDGVGVFFKSRTVVSVIYWWWGEEEDLVLF